MKIYAISDLHLSGTTNKPMDIFGGNWDNYWDIIQKNWRDKITDEDVVLISGDISWAMNLCDALPDLDAIGELPGKKIIIRGNHDYWWSSYKKICDELPVGMYAIQNNAIKLGNIIFCGTRLWSCVFKTEQDKKVYEHELLRLKFTLDAGKALGDEPIALMLHYPPFNVLYEDNEVTDLISQYNVKAVIYGHLHGKDVRSKLIVDKGGLKYYLTSCDQIANNPIEIPITTD